MSTTLPPPSPPWHQGLIRTALRLVAIGLFAWGMTWAYEWIHLQVLSLSGIGQSRVVLGVLALALIGYTVVIAVPFFPGIEIGIALLLMEGAAIAPFVYAATVAGLFGAFLVGHLLPPEALAGTFRDLRLLRTAALLERLKTVPPEARLQSLSARLPGWLARPLVGWRYVTIALLVNLPGTIALGGGGGILMVAGVSGLFSPRLVLLTLFIATLPVPLAVWLTGLDWLR